MEPPTTESILEYWSLMAEWYSETLVDTTTAVCSTYIHLLQLNTAKNILEVACGTGNGIEILLRNTAENTRITGCDLTPAMLAIAQTQNFPRTSLVVANNEELPFADSGFDRYVANLSLMIVEDPVKMLKESFRVLQTGGIAVFSV